MTANNSASRAYHPDSFPALEIDIADDGLIRLSCSDPLQNFDSVILLHPLQVQHLAEKLGLLASAQRDPHLHQELRSLRRRLRVAAERTDRLRRLLSHCGDHEDLDLEKALCTATCELLDDWVAELDDDGEPDAPGIAPPAASQQPSPSDGKPHGTPMAIAKQRDLVDEAGGGA